MINNEITRASNLTVNIEIVKRRERERISGSPSLQWLPIVPAGHRHWPVTLSHEAPEQSHDSEQPIPKLPSAQSIRTQHTVMSWICPKPQTVTETVYLNTYPCLCVSC